MNRNLRETYKFFVSPHFHSLYNAKGEPLIFEGFDSPFPMLLVVSLEDVLVGVKKLDHA